MNTAEISERSSIASFEENAEAPPLERSGHVVTPEGRIIPKEYVQCAYFDATDIWNGSATKTSADWILGSSYGLDLQIASAPDNLSSVTWGALENAGSFAGRITTTDNASGGYTMSIGLGGTTADNSMEINNMNQLDVNGDLNVTGDLTANTKDFKIPHPNPDLTNAYNLHHRTVESPTAGENLYRYTVTIEEDGGYATVKLPDYFKYLNKNVNVYVLPEKHYGRAYGKINANDLKVEAKDAGKYNVLIIGTRKDNHAIESWEGAVRERD